MVVWVGVTAPVALVRDGWYGSSGKGCGRPERESWTRRGGGSGSQRSRWPAVIHSPAGWGSRGSQRGAVPSAGAGSYWQRGVSAGGGLADGVAVGDGGWPWGRAPRSSTVPPCPEASERLFVTFAGGVAGPVAPRWAARPAPTPMRWLPGWLFLPFRGLLSATSEY